MNWTKLLEIGAAVGGWPVWLDAFAVLVAGTLAWKVRPANVKTQVQFGKVQVDRTEQSGPVGFVCSLLFAFLVIVVSFRMVR